MNKRDTFAILALLGLLIQNKSGDLAEQAVALADDLIRRLDEL